MYSSHGAIHVRWSSTDLLACSVDFGPSSVRKNTGVSINSPLSIGSLISLVSNHRRNRTLFYEYSYAVGLF